VTDPQRTGHENETEVIPALNGQGVPRTQELPVVEAAPAPAASPVVHPAPRPAQTAFQAPPPAAPPPAAPPPAVPPPPPPAAPPAAVRPPSERWRVALVVVTALVLAVALGAVVVRTRSTTTTQGGGGTTAASVALDATITSVDPSGGSGLRQQGGTWRTQTYTTADFGKLKDGVGLLLDVGTPRAVTSVDLDAVGGPITVELRAGDERGTDPTAFARVGGAVQASGATSLPAKSGGRHRYWLVWVTRLAAQDGGYRAVIRDPAAKGSPG
jgi:hypothetical protein